MADKSAISRLNIDQQGGGLWAATLGDRKYHLLQVIVQGARVLPGLHSHQHDFLP